MAFDLTNMPNLRVTTRPGCAAIITGTAQMGAKRRKTLSRADETPKDWSGLKAPGYWSAQLGYFVPVRIISETEVAERRTERAEWHDRSL